MDGSSQCYLSSVCFPSMHTNQAFNAGIFYNRTMNLQKARPIFGGPVILQPSLPGMFHWVSADSPWHSSPQTQTLWSILWHGKGVMWGRTTDGEWGFCWELPGPAEWTSSSKLVIKKRKCVRIIKEKNLERERSNSFGVIKELPSCNKQTKPPGEHNEM